MNWPEQRRGRILAGIYVVAFAAMLVGLVWTLGKPATGGGGAQLIAGFALFVAAQLTITALAFGLRRRVLDTPGTGAPSGYQRAWQRLSLGLELPTALRLLVT